MLLAFLVLHIQVDHWTTEHDPSEQKHPSSPLLVRESGVFRQFTWFFWGEGV